jgi:hypothetical protein
LSWWGCSRRASPGAHGPAVVATKSATWSISGGDNWPANAGIAPRPRDTIVVTAAFGGFSWSRFGPTVLADPAEASV